MSGLEASEVALSEVVKSSSYLRIEAEYFIADTKVRGYLGRNIALSCDYGTSDSLNEDQQGYPVLRLNELINMFVQKPTKYCDTLTKIEYEILHLKKGDVIVCRTNGNPDLVGKCAVVMEDMPYAFASYCFRVRTNSLILPTVLAAFLSCKYGRMEIDKHAMKGNQTNFSPAKFKDINIPKLNYELQERIEHMFVTAYGLLNKANAAYSTAAQFLLSELELNNFIPSTDPIAIKSFSNSFGANGRLDAEYYQPKYEEMLAAINKTKADVLSNLVFVKKSIEPGSSEYTDEGIPFVRVSNITKFGITDPEIHLSRVPFANMALQPKRDTILFTKDGTVGIAYKVENDLDIVTSGALLHLTVKDIKAILPDYLTLVLNSMVVQMQAERDTGGSIIIHWRPSDIGKIVIPILDLPIQNKIAIAVQESFSLRHLSQLLLDTAKRAVEIAIDQGEKIAIKWLEKESKE